MKIVTNSQTIEEVKDPENCSIFSLYKLFANKEHQAELRNKYLAGGMGWGYAKQELYEVMNETLTPIREEYNKLIENKDYIDAVLKKGAEKAGKRGIFNHSGSHFNSRRFWLFTITYKEPA